MKLASQWTAAAILTLGAVGAQATPAVWVDTLDFNPDKLITHWTSFDYSHDINDDGFNAGSDTISGYSLSLSLYDDASDSWWDAIEGALIDLPGIVGDAVYFDLSGSEFGGWSLSGHTTLQATGTLDVTVASLWGDFKLGSSTLTVRGDSVGVPEPATLGLFGLGMLGVAFGMRRRKASSGPAA